MTKKSNRVVIEAMEQRVLFDVTGLSEAFVSSTLPTSISDQAVLHGTVVASISNNSGIDVKEKPVGIGIFIADGQIDVVNPNYAVLKGKVGLAINLLNGQSKTYSFPINIPKGHLNDGVDTMFVVVAEAGGGFSVSAAGPTITVHPPIVTLSETETFAKLPDSAVAGAKIHEQDVVAITNSGTDPATGALTLGVYATPDGIPADGSLINSVSKKMTIAAGKTVKTQVPLASIPALAAGTYKLITQVTQANGTVTTSDPTTAPTFTVTVPTTGTAFSETIVTATAKNPTSVPLQGQYDYIAELDLNMTISNTGTASDGASITFTLFASSSTTIDQADPSSGATQVGQLMLTPTIPANLKNGKLTLDFGISTIPTDSAATGSTQDYIFVETTDPHGVSTFASWGKLVEFEGLATDFF